MSFIFLFIGGGGALNCFGLGIVENDDSWGYCNWNWDWDWDGVSGDSYSI